MKQKLIVFFVTFIPFGLIMGLLLKPFTIGIMLALFYSVLTTVILSLIQRVNLKRTGQSGEKINVNNEIVLEIAASKQEAFQLCTHALGEVEKCSIGLSNLNKGILTATTGVNWLTWGDELSVHIEHLGGHCTVKLTSRPKVKTTVMDYGKNRDNIKRMVQYLQHSPYKIKIVRDEGAIVRYEGSKA
jgi:hypothetical protein